MVFLLKHNTMLLITLSIYPNLTKYYNAMPQWASLVTTYNQHPAVSYNTLLLIQLPAHTFLLKYAIKRCRQSKQTVLYASMAS